MEIVGRVDSLWRYPVKSMRGESLPEVFAGFVGVSGDRVYAFHSSAARPDFPYLTGREQPLMLRCRPANRDTAAMVILPAAAAVDVHFPSGEVLAIDDPQVIAALSEGMREGLRLTLLRSDRALADCHPISLISIQTAQQVSAEVGAPVDKRRFRANVYVDLASSDGFGENAWVGRRLQIGETVQLTVLQRDTRCKMITLDPDTSEASPDVLRVVSKQHEGTAGVYAAVLVDGIIRTGDSIAVLE